MLVAGIVCLVGAAAVSAAAVYISGLSTAANVATVLSLILAIPAAAVGLLNWTRRAPGRPTAAELAEAREELAEAVGLQWRRELEIRVPDHPFPMPVYWRLTPRAELMDHPGQIGPHPIAGSSGDPAGLAAQFRALRRRRLVIVGGPGVGKTTLALQLLVELLRSRTAEEPVPVLMSMTGWSWSNDDPPDMNSWIARQLVQDYPLLNAGRRGVVNELIKRGAILPVLDGLDELSEAARSTVFGTLQNSLSHSSEAQIILTSRTGEFARSVQAGPLVIPAAAVIEPDPLTAAAAAGYLGAAVAPLNLARWEPVLAALTGSDPPAVLAEITSTPLGLWLLRVAYAAKDPGPLLDPDLFDSARKLRGHLFDQLIPALLESRRSDGKRGLFEPRPSRDPVNVRRWLETLARQLDQMPRANRSSRYVLARQGANSGASAAATPNRDFRWWFLGLVALPRWVMPAAYVLTGFVLGAVTGLALSTDARALHGDPGQIGQALLGAVQLGVVGAVLGLLAAFTANESRYHEPYSGDPRTARRRLQLVGAVGLGGLVGALFGLGLSALFWLLQRTVSGIWGKHAPGLITWLVGKTPVSASTYSALALIGVAVGILLALTFWAEFAPQSTGPETSTPYSSWRTDLRVGRVKIIGFGLTGACFGGIPDGGAGSLRPDLPGAVTWCAIGLLLGLWTGQRAWFVNRVAVVYLAAHHRIPLRFMAFLDDAYRIGLLRTVGPIYQFRHAEFQDHLAPPRAVAVPVNRSYQGTYPFTAPEGGSATTAKRRNHLLVLGFSGYGAAVAIASELLFGSDSLLGYVFMVVMLIIGVGAYVRLGRRK